MTAPFDPAARAPEKKTSNTRALPPHMFAGTAGERTARSAVHVAGIEHSHPSTRTVPYAEQVTDDAFLPMARNPPALRFRLLLDDEHALGPGKVDLLEAIAASGSIAAAGRAMGMSYKRAWQLADELNRSFAAPLITANKGGEHGGGASLTAAGEKVVAAYRDIERKAKRACTNELQALSRLLSG